MAPKRAETDIAHIMTRFGIWRYKLADVAVPFWNKKASSFQGVKYQQQKPFDYVIGNQYAFGAIEAKSGQTSFQFMTLTTKTGKWEIQDFDNFARGYSNTPNGHWPDDLESAGHGIQPHQRRALTTIQDMGCHPYIALQMGTGPVNSSKCPLRFWLVPWDFWLYRIELPLLTLESVSLPYSSETTNRRLLINDKLTAVDRLKAYELQWDSNIQESIKWNLPISHPFRTTFGVQEMYPQPANHGSIQRKSSITEPTVSLVTSEELSPQM